MAATALVDLTGESDDDCGDDVRAALLAELQAVRSIVNSALRCRRSVEGAGGASFFCLRTSHRTGRGGA